MKIDFHTQREHMEQGGNSIVDIIRI